jgi:hypothetical protein
MFEKLSKKVAWWKGGTEMKTITIKMATDNKKMKDGGN